MLVVWAWALWSVVGASPASPACPAHCACALGDETEYSCAVRGDTVTVKARDLDYANIDCEGGALTCSDFPLLQIGGNRTLPSLSIRDCSLPDPLQCIARRLSATDIQLLILRNVSTALERKHVEGLGVTKLMMFDAGAQKSIPTEALSSLPSLQHFRLCGGRVELTGGEFLLSPPLTYLELATDNITRLPKNSFQGLQYLKTLNLWGNDIREVSDDAFRGLQNLEELYISSSRVRRLPPRLLSHTPALRVVGLMRNLLTELPEGLFHGLQRLQQVTISNDAPLAILPHSFSHLPSLTSLKLDQASIPSLPTDFLLNCTSLANLSLVQNNLHELPDGGFQGLDSLERLDLSYNKIKTISNQMFVRMKSLKELRMDGNLVEELPSQVFTGLRRLQSVSLSSNRLRHIHATSFQGCDSILALVLSRNNLTLAPSPAHQYFDLEQYSPFNTLLRLQTLDLSRNTISNMFTDWKNVLLQLTHLNLAYNSFQEITAADVQFLSLQIVIDLRHNNISTIYLSPAYNLQQESSQSRLLLDDNPLHCDCRLYEAAKRLKGLKPLTVEPVLDLNGAYCASPPNLEGVQFTTLPIDDLVCDITCNGCRCKIRPSTDSLYVDCFNDTTLPDPASFGLAHSVVRLQTPPDNLTTIPDYVTVLNLSRLGLKSVPEFVPKSLEVLDISDNKLEQFPMELLKRKLSLKLSGNAFPCECGTVDEIAAMNKYSRKIIDWQRVKCKDGAYMWKLEVDKLCLVQRAALLGGVLATLGIILAASAVLMYRYSIEIRVFLTNRGWLCCFIDKYDATKKYDVFISFAHKDETFVVDKLLPKLEKDYRVCVHHRDWRVGDLIPAQIARSVEESRRTMIVLSKNFLDSTWGMLEFRTAHVQAVREKKVRVIVLLLEDLAHMEVDRELQAYLTTNTYVKWGDPWFWEKLQFALPKRTSAEQVRSEKRTKMAVENMTRGGLHVTLTADGKLVNANNKHAM